MLYSSSKIVESTKSLFNTNLKKSSVFFGNFFNETNLYYISSRLFFGVFSKINSKYSVHYSFVFMMGTMKLA